MMQLFVLDKKMVGPRGARGEGVNDGTIDDEALCHQISRVLRMRVGDECGLQRYDGPMTTRCIVCLTQVSPREVMFQIIHTECREWSGGCVDIALALPHRREAQERAVQKLAEIGVGHIYRRKAQRSQVATIAVKQLHRLDRIATEATEQSRGWRSVGQSVGLPHEQYDHVLIADRGGQDIRQWVVEKKQSDARVCIIIGPEGGLVDHDYELRREAGYVPERVSLGSSVLRWETAAVVAAFVVRDER